MLFKKYDPNYENGRCPLGYEFVEAHDRNGTWIDSYCRKMPKKRFRNPDAQIKRLQEQKKLESLEMAQEAVNSRGYEDYSGEDKL